VCTYNNKTAVHNTAKYEHSKAEVNQRYSKGKVVPVLWHDDSLGVVVVVVVVVEVYLHTFFAFLTLIPHGGESSATCPNHLAGPLLIQ
jgi:hypothetical protein